MESWPCTACWAAWLGKREGVKLAEMVMEVAKASRTVHHSSALLSCDEKYSKHKLLTAQCAGLPFFNEKERFALSIIFVCYTVGAQCVTPV